MLQNDFGDNTLSKLSGIKRFMEDRECIKDEPRFGKPSPSTNEKQIDQVRDLVLIHPRLTIMDIILEAPISFESCQANLRTHLGLRRVASRVVSKTLISFQKQQWVQVAFFSNGDAFSRRVLKTHCYE